MAKRKSKRTSLFRDVDGFVRAEDYFRPEKKRMSLEEYKQMITFAEECIAKDREDWDLFCKAFPLPSETS